MKKMYLSAAIIVALIAQSCNGGNDTEAIDKSLQIENPTTTETVQADPTAPTETPNVILPDSLLNPDFVQKAPTIDPKTLPGTHNPDAKGLNPEHGQPGHRCDIPVGAPLSTPPKTMPANQTVNSTPTPPPTPAPTQMNLTSPDGKKLNPAHGQPGHRCDIAVGAPLPE